MTSTAPGRDQQVVRDVLASVGDLDIDRALTLVTEDIVLELPFREDGGPRRLDGPKAREFFHLLPTLFTRLAFTEVVVHGALPSGVVVAEYRSDGLTHSGRPYPNRYVALFTLRDGRIATWREYFNPSVVAAAFS